MPSSCASSITTSVWFTCPEAWASRSASWTLISDNMSSVIMARRRGMSERSQASCRVTKLRLAAVRKPSVSKSAGTPHPCDPDSAEPIMEPPVAGRAGSTGALLRSQGRADASLPTWSGLYCRGMPRGTPAPAPSKASGLATALEAEAARLRRIMPTTAITASASSPNRRI